MKTNKMLFGAAFLVAGCVGVNTSENCEQVSRFSGNVGRISAPTDLGNGIVSIQGHFQSSSLGESRRALIYNCNTAQLLSISIYFEGYTDEASGTVVGGELDRTAEFNAFLQALSNNPRTTLAEVEQVAESYGLNGEIKDADGEPCGCALLYPEANASWERYSG